MIRLAIFDCDGTLADSGGGIHAALSATLAEHGLPPMARADSQRVIGLSLEQAMAALAPDGDAAAMAATYRRVYTELRLGGAMDEPLFPGIAEALTAFDAAGWALAVATGKSRRGLERLLDAHGLRDRFISLQTADSAPSKPAPDMALNAMAEAGATAINSVMIGDTGWDMGCGRGAGTRCLGVAWGYHGLDELWRSGAQTVAASPADLLPMATALIEGKANE